MRTLKTILRWWRSYVHSLNRRQKYLGTVIHLIVTVTLTFILLSISHLFFISSTIVSGNSMEPTLNPSDRLLILKSGPVFHSVSNNVYTPARGSIIVFTAPKSPGNLIIKRVVGLPGERITIKNGQLTIYNQEFPQGFQPDINLEADLNVFKKSESIDLEIESDEVFVLGDNRQASSDSRTLGTIKTDNIVGRLITRFWPITELNWF